MPTSTIFRFLVPAEATSLIVGEDGVTKQIPDAGIAVSDEGDTPGLSDRIISISGDQQHGEAACQMIIQRLYEAQEVAPGDQGIFVLLVPDTFEEGEDVLRKVKDISGAEIHLEPDAIPSTGEAALQIVGGYQETVTAVFQLGALIASDPSESSERLEAEFQTASQSGLENRKDEALGIQFLPEPVEEELEPEQAEQEPAEHLEPEQPEASEAQPEGAEGGEGAEGEEQEKLEANEASSCVPEEAEGEIEFLEEPPCGISMSACFAVSTSVAAWVVGRKGQSVMNLRDQSKAEIDVSNDASTYRMVGIHGDHDAVMLGIKLLLEHISLLPDGSPEFVQMVLPPNTAGYIIGRGGEAIKELRRKSQAEIDLDQVKDDKNLSLLKIGGSVKGMTRASQLVAQRLAEAAGKLGPRSDIEQLQALLTESNHLEASLTMLISADAVNRVPKARLSQVERLTGSAIEVDGLGGRTSGVQQLQIVGTRKGNAMAILYLQDIFGEHLRTSPGAVKNGAPVRGDGAVPRSKSSGRTNGVQNRPSSRGPPRGRGAAKGYSQSRRQ